MPHLDRVPLGQCRIGIREAIQDQEGLANSPYSSPHTHPSIKTEKQPKIAAIPHTMAMPKQATKSLWGPQCPICKSEEENGEEDLDGDLQDQPRMCPPNFQHLQPQPHPQPQLQPQSFQCPQPQNMPANI